MSLCGLTIFLGEFPLPMLDMLLGNSQFQPSPHLLCNRPESTLPILYICSQYWGCRLVLSRKLLSCPLKNPITVPQHLAVQAASSLAKIALNVNLTILVQTDVVTSFYTRATLAHIV